jgi:uncharacterized membrane protein
MTEPIQSTRGYWWALGVTGAFALILVILLLTGAVGAGVWWTAAAMILLALSQALSIRAIARRNRRLAESASRARNE